MQQAAKAIPSLVAVFDDKAFYDKNVASVLDVSYFKEVVRGSTLEDFSGIMAEEGPIVMLVMGKNSNPIMDAMCKTKRVQWVHSFNTGVDAFKLHTIKDSLANIPVSNARSVFINPLAEHIVFSCLYFNRRIAQIQSNKKNKIWDRFPNHEMCRQSMGIIGYGDIAKGCAKMVRGMGMTVTGLRRSEVANGSMVDELGVTVQTNTPDNFDRVLRESDFVLNVMPLTADNHNMFNKDVFAKMRSDAVFMNIGRGACVNEADLVEALNTNVIKGASLDVFAVEPLPESSPLWSVSDDKLMLTPHSADITHTCMRESGEYFMELAKAFVSEGTIPKYLVDIGRGY